MDFRSLMLRLIAGVALAMLVSCIDGREEIWVNGDGSGRAEVAYTLPAAAATFHGGPAGVRRMVEDFLKDAPGISASSCEVTTEGDRLRIHVSARFDSAVELQEISRGDAIRRLPDSATGLSGDFRVAVKGLSIDFARTIDAGKSLPGARLMPVSQFKDRRLIYIFHLPEAATSSNATRTDHSGRTLIWDFPLSEAIQGPMTTRFVAPVPFPRRAIIAACAVMLLAALFACRKLMRPKIPTG